MLKKKVFSYENRARIVTTISVFILLLLYAFKNTSFFIRALSAVGLIVFFFLIDYYFDVRFKKIHYLFIFIISASSFLLSPLYYIYPQYDKIQHFVLPIMFASIVFFMVNKLKLAPKWKFTFTFFIVIGSLGLFEIGEYLLDVFFDLKLQGVFLRSIQGIEKFDILLDRIDDTMIDLILGTLGTAIYCVFGFFKNIKKK